MSSYMSFAEIGDDNHVLIHVLPDDHKGSPRSWQQYIHDLDYFFSKVYKYHQRCGFACIILSQVLELIQFAFVVLFTLFLIHCVDYAVLFKDKAPPTHGTSTNSKVTIADCILPLKSATFHPIEVIVLIFASLFWFLKFIKMVQSAIIYMAIKSFYVEVLRVNDCSQYTWQDIQTRLVQAQHLCLIQDGYLNELDIHNRILRHQNYLIALLNKRLLPVHFKLPIIGEVTYLSKGLQYNIELLLFKGPFALFENNWKLRDEIKSANNRQICAEKLAKYCLILACFNFFLFPFTFLWQILHAFYANAEVLKRDPSLLGTRNWSLYSRVYCRHFNELDHQLNERLNKGYKAATKYMNSFTSPLMEILSNHVAFISAAILSVLIILTAYDEDVITIEHVITVMTGCGLALAIARSFMKTDMPLKHTQTELNFHILEHIHYKSHGYSPSSTQAYQAMSTLFQYKIVRIFEELISPVVTPYILVKHFLPKSLEIVDFFRNYSVEVQGIGDVCTFAMMNIEKNGNPVWKAKSEERQFTIKPMTLNASVQVQPVPENLVTENGKLELSLINFKLTNPTWQPYNEQQQQFIDYVTNKATIREHNEESIMKQSLSQSTSTTSPQTSIIGDKKLESSYSMERSKLLSNIMHDEKTDEKSVVMSLSTLYLHEYASTHDSEIKPKDDRTESDPLLTATSSSTRFDLHR
ncbi:autophagy-related protein 9A-like isoform X2 [Dinothrombium tinctorium]|uniref:Autophagy-related protein 9 n=1 Tax=Dinothrombium tinctorium TaxID=1965070 RepID=A0A443RG28_9ACAR|nr:autophagy-related protein 9A-like isoform X2 [Dinothrombium tinctorium]